MNHKGTILIETDRLILRKFRHSDSRDMFNNWCSDAKVTSFLSWQTHKEINDTEEILKLFVSGYEDDCIYNWVIVLKDINEAIGNIVVVELEDENKSCEVAYCVSSRYWNKGIVTEAFKAIIKFLFEEVNVNRIAAKHDINNIASGKVMQKCGMVYEGTLREIQFRNNRFCNVAVYSILRNEWINAPKRRCI